MRGEVLCPMKDGGRKDGAVREQGASYEDYAVLPEEAGRFELLDGTLLAMSPGPSTLHQMVSKELQKALYECDASFLC